MLNRYLLVVILLATTFIVNAQSSKIKNLKVTILSTMLSDGGIGEWGFAALIEVDGRKILFDTGLGPETVLLNARQMKIDLSDVVDVFISHSHNDHTGGLLTLRNELMKKNPAALSVVHIGEGSFYPRPSSAEYTSFVQAFKNDFEKTGGKFVVYTKPVELFPGVWNTGPVPRTYPEKNWGGRGKVKLPTGDVVDDYVPEDQSLVFNTNDGLLIVSGCGHAGVINTIDYAKSILKSSDVNTLIGGFHLFELTDDEMKWTSDKIKAANIENFIGAHCTGINAVYTIRENLGLDRAHAVVGAVGAGFELGKGILPGLIAK